MKILQVILVGSLSIAAISACGGEDSASSSSSSSTSAAVESTVVDEATTVVEATEAPAPDVPASGIL